MFLRFFHSCQVKPVSLEESDGEDLFASPQPAKQASNVKSNNVLSLFGDEEEDMEEQFATNIIQPGPGKASMDTLLYGNTLPFGQRLFDQWQLCYADMSQSYILH